MQNPSSKFYPPRRSWTLGRLLSLFLAASYCFLMVEIRYEHKDILKHVGIPWIPIAFSGLALVVGVVAALVWNRPARLVLNLVFAISLIVGAAGVYFHTGRKPWKAAGVLEAWVKPADQVDGNLSSPPALAPLAFCGLGLFGLVAGMRRWDEPSTS